MPPASTSTSTPVLKTCSTLLLALAFPTLLCAQEVCNNGLDDDNDGLIDLNDPDCPCSTLVAADDLPSYIRNHSFEDRLCCPLSFVSVVSPPWLDCANGWHQATIATSDYFHECGYSPVGFNLPPADGDGAVGFFAQPGYFEYVGTCLTWPLPSNPLLAGVTYTLSLWISAAAVNSYHSQTLAQADPSYWSEQLPLAIFGHADECVEFPIPTLDCIGLMPGWSELGRVMVQPAWEWTRVSITFTPTQDIHSILIGGGCDVPASFSGKWIVNAEGEGYYGTPYFLVDDLLLTEAQDQVLQPVAVTGNLCAEDAGALAIPPAGASGFQWYLDGVAIPGQTTADLDISGMGLGPGTYTMTSTFNGQCLMGNSFLPPASAPVPQISMAPDSGCAPLTVAFADTTGGGTQTIHWDLGDGNTTADSAFTHTYTAPGSFDVTLRVRDAAGCEGELTIPDAITVFPGANGQINANPNPVDAEDPTVQLSGSGSADIISWWWDLGAANPSTSTDQDVEADFPAVPGDYPVMLVVSTTNGCVDTVLSMVTVINPGVIEMPNVFSPNGDGRNDRFIPIGYKGAPGLMEIYNRWGQVVFSTRNLVQGWNGSGFPDGTYFFIVTPDSPGTGALTGHITLVR